MYDRVAVNGVVGSIILVGVYRRRLGVLVLVSNQPREAKENTKVWRQANCGLVFEERRAVGSFLVRHDMSTIDNKRDTTHYIREPLDIIHTKYSTRKRAYYLWYFVLYYKVINRTKTRVDW